MQIITTDFYPDQVNVRYTFKMENGGTGMAIANYTPSNGRISHSIPEYIPYETKREVAQYMKDAWEKHYSAKMIEAMTKNIPQ